MYLGDSDHTLDSKGRLIIPSRFREALGEKIIITRSLDPCLCIYDMEAWSSFCARLAELPSNDVNQRKLVRFFPGRRGRSRGRQTGPRPHSTETPGQLWYHKRGRAGRRWLQNRIVEQRRLLLQFHGQ